MKSSLNNSKKPNIIFILMDACRRDHLGCYGYDKPTSPNIDKLAKESIVFENAFSVGNSTNPCLTSIFSGHHILTHGLIQHVGTEQKEIDRFNKSGIKVLPEILKEHGYTTWAFDWLGRWQKKGYDYYQGLGEHEFKIGLFGVKLPYETADGSVKNFEKKIKQNNEKPFFAFLHFWDTHSPYSPPSKFIRRFRKYDYPSVNSSETPLEWATEWIHLLTKNSKEVFARYDGSINFADFQIGKIIKFLKKRRIYDNTIIIVTADHGENLIDHNIHFSHYALYDTTLRIPFIMRIPNITSARIGSFFQEIDFLPTMLGYLGIKSPKADGKCFDLENDKKNMEKRKELYFVANDAAMVAFRDEKYKYIYELIAGIEEAYDLKKDPFENKNIIGSNKTVDETLRNKLRGAIMKTKKVRERVYGKNKIVYNKLHYSLMSKRVSFLERLLKEKEKEIEDMYDSKAYRLINAYRKLRGKLGI